MCDTDVTFKPAIVRVTPNLALAPASGDEGEFDAFPLCILPPMPVVELLMIRQLFPPSPAEALAFRWLSWRPAALSSTFPPLTCILSPSPATLNTWQGDKVVDSEVREVFLSIRFFLLQYNHRSAAGLEVFREFLRPALDPPKVSTCLFQCTEEKNTAHVKAHPRL